MGPMVKRQLSADQILATGLRNQWYAICPSDMVPQGGVHRVRRLGIDEHSLVVFYGDKNNWWATYAFWVFRLFVVPNLRIMDGGRARWEQENRPMSTAVPSHAPGDITVGERVDAPIRAFRDDVFEHIAGRRPLVDVRSPEEYSGERMHMPDYPNEGSLRGGHIPGAKSVPSR